MSAAKKICTNILVLGRYTNFSDSLLLDNDTALAAGVNYSHERLGWLTRETESFRMTKDGATKIQTVMWARKVKIAPCVGNRIFR